MLQDVSFYYKGALITSDSGKTIDPAILPVQAGALLATFQYAPGNTAKSVTGTTFAAFDSANLQTGSFTAPASGNVLVTVTCVAKTSASTVLSLALAAHGTVSPLVANSVNYQESVTNSTKSIMVRFYVTGLTPGTSYNFDLLGASGTGTYTIQCLGSTSTTGGGTAGGPVVFTVQAA